MFADKFLSSRFERPKPHTFPQGLSEQIANCGPEKFKGQRSSTVVFALAYKDGVLLAGDRRTSSGYYEIVDDSTIKVVQITSRSGFAAAGLCNIIEDLETSLKSACVAFSQLYSQELSPDGQAGFLQNRLEPWWFTSMFYWYWMVGVPILAAYDVVLEKPRIFIFDETGYHHEPEFFGGTGCGFEAIRGLVNDHWVPNIDKEKAILIAMKAMLQSGIASSGVSDARLSLPTIAIIEKDGFKNVPDDVLDGVRQEIIKKSGGLK